MPVKGVSLQDRDLASLDAGLPVALLPVRIETRFAKGAHRDPDLLVRIYPDQIHVDAHEPELTAAEAEWGEHFWVSDYRAGSNADRRAAAWEQLSARLGPSRAAWVARAMRPTNLAQRPTAEVAADAQPSPMPALPTPQGRTSEWTKAARARMLPERFAVVGYSNGKRLFVEWTSARADDPVLGPSPEHEVPAGADTPVDEGMRWMTDFDEAVAVGLAVRISGVTGMRRGLDLLAVFGARSGIDPLDEAASLGDLLEGHRYTDGLGLPAPGTPTNSTDGERSSFSKRRRTGAPSAWLEDDPQTGRPSAGSDGDRLASALAVDPDVLIDVEGADHRNAAEAAQMQAVLWPGTGGYALEQLMNGVATPAQRAAIADHFERHVRPAGPLPPLRAGAQPYGILPVAPLETVAPQRASADFTEAVRLLRGLRSVWESALAEVARAGGSDPDQALLRVLAMEGRTQAFAARPLLGPDYVRDLLALLDPADLADRENELREFEVAVTALVHGPLGLAGQPRLARAVYSEASARIVAPVTQREELSEDKPLAKDYLAWLVKAPLAHVLAGQDPQSHPFGDERKPLLFHLARAAILCELAGTAREVLAAAHPPGPPELEPEYVLGPNTRTMLWRLQQKPPTGGAATLGDALWPAGGAQSISQRVDAFRRELHRLATLPSARLDRIFRETIDAHGARLDAWVTSLATRQLWDLRAAQPDGLQVGGYGWVEDLRPARGVRALPAGKAHTQRDASGFIHAPSAAHAATAAILRSGQLSHADTSSGRALGIDLSSRRVRDVDTLLDGLRQGQSLGELFGYRVERSLHDVTAVRLDRFVPAVRALCPARGGRLLPDAPAASRNGAGGVVDGMTLLRRHRGEGPAIPWSTGGLPASGSAEQKAIAGVLDAVAELADSLSDAVIAESVHQAGLGNTLRSGGSLDALDRGEAPPPELEFAHGPRSGIAVTHRVGVLREAGGDPLAGRAGWTSGHPRTLAEPTLSAIAAELLPLPGRVHWQVRYDRTDGQPGSFWEGFTLADLDLAPLDVVYASVTGTPGAAELEQRAVDAARAAHPAFPGDITLVPDRDPTWGADIWTLPQLQQAAAAVRALLAGTRALTAADLAAVGASGTAAASAASLYSDRIQPLLADFTTAITAVDNAVAALDAGQLRSALVALSAFALPDAVPGGEDLDSLVDQADRVLETARDREAAANDSLTGFDATAAGALELLVAAARTILDRTFAVAPPVAPPAALTFAHSSDLCRGDDAAPDRWLGRVARVRPNVELLEEALACRAASAALADRGAAGTVSVSQWPQPGGQTVEAWAGLPDAGTPAAARTSLVFEGAAGVDLSGDVAGLLVDEWTEVVPADYETTAVAFGYDAPGAAAPQAVLLGVPPAHSGAWDAEAVEAIVLDARRLSLLRLVDPDVVPAVGHLLPALFLATNSPEETISTDMTKAI